MKRKVLVKQHDATDCGAACLSMICFYYHKELSITKLRDVLGTDIKGTTLAGLAKGAEFLGFETKALRVDMENFQEPFTLPAIAHVLTDEGLAHYIVIRKIKKVMYGYPIRQRAMKGCLLSIFTMTLMVFCFC